MYRSTLLALMIVATICWSSSLAQSTTDERPSHADLLAELVQAGSEVRLQEVEEMLATEAGSGQLLDWAALGQMVLDSSVHRSIRESALRILLTRPSDDQLLPGLGLTLLARALDRNTDGWVVEHAMLTQMLESVLTSDRTDALTSPEWASFLQGVAHDAGSAHDDPLARLSCRAATVLPLDPRIRSGIIREALLAFQSGNFFGAPEVNALLEEDRRRLRESLAASIMNREAFPFAATSALASIGDSEAAKLLLRMKSSGTEDLHLQRFLDQMSDAANARQSRAGILSYIGDGPMLSSSAIIWATEAALDMGIEKEAIRNALQGFAQRVQSNARGVIRNPDSAEAHTNSVLLPVKVTAVRHGVIAESDWPDVGSSTEHSAQPR